MADQMTPAELRADADTLEAHGKRHGTVAGDSPAPEFETALEAMRRLADVIELHRPCDADAVTGDCAEETCEHEDVCPTQVFRVCIECWNVAEASDPYFGERGITPVLWPCDTARAARGDTTTNENRSE